MNKKITLYFLLMLGSLLAVQAQTQVLFEDFENPVDSATPPAGWENVQYYTIAPATDFWRYDNPGGRTVGGGFSGLFAIFDSEEYSNNGTLEDIGLVSPVMNTLGLEQVHITFDMAGMAAPTAVGTLFVEVFDGSVWREVTRYVDTTTSWGRDTLDASQFIRNRCDAQVRFRWFCQSGGWFALDNVEVFSPDNRNTTNVQLAEMVTPRPDGCADPNVALSVRVINAGTDALSNIPMFAEIFDGNTTQNYNFTVSELPVCADTVVVFPGNISIAYDSVFDFTIYSDLSGDQVRVNSDTTTVLGFQNLPVPLFFPDLDSSICGTSFFRDSLPLSGNQYANWYANQDDTIPLFSGPRLQLGRFGQDTTLFLETGFRQLFSAPTNSSAGTAAGVAWGAAINSGYWIDVIAKTDIYLDSLDVRTRNSGVMDYEIYTTNGPYLDVIDDPTAWTQAYTGAASVTAGTRSQVYVGGIFIKAGDTLGIHFFDGSALLPEVYGGVPHIVDNPQIKTFSSHYMNGSLGPLSNQQVLNAFGYNLNFYYRLECEGTFSRRTYRKPTELLQTAIEVSTPYDGIQDNTRDIVAEGGRLTYEMPPPRGLTNADFGSKWDITFLSFTTENGFPIPASDYTITNNPPSGNNNLTLSYTAPFGWADSSLRVDVIIQDLDVAPFCDSPLLKRIFIAPTPEVNFAYSQACQNAATTFTNLSSIQSGFNTYVWYFGDGDSSTLITPSHIYNGFGDYDVRLVATSDLGIVKDTTITITVLETPIAAFTVPNRCEGFNFTAQNNSVFSTGTPSYFWNLGEGITSTDANPVYTYANPGTYLVRLRVVGDNGCSDSASRETTMFDTPVADFIASHNDVCASQRIAFENTTKLNVGKFGSSWNIANIASSNLPNTSFQFPGPGTYPVRLVVESEFGCRDTVSQDIRILQSPVLDFDILGNCSATPLMFDNNSTIPQGTTPAYHWNFNQEGSATDSDPEFLFTVPGNKTVTLTIALDNGCSGELSKQVMVNPQAIASFDHRRADCDQIIFTNTTPRSAGTVDFAWNFGDGNSSVQRNPVHNYNVTGTQSYTVSLIASINGTCPDTASLQLQAAPAPVCDFSIAEEWIPGHRGFKFTPSETGAASYRWSFGDGRTSDDESPTHQYLKDGNYTVRLTVTNDIGCECSKTVGNSVVNASTSQIQDGSQVSLYPNPAQDHINFEYALQSNLKSVTLVDNLGKVVKVVEHPQGLRNATLSIAVDTLAPGVYFLKADTENGAIVSRFIVSR